MPESDALYTAWFPRRASSITIVAPPADESLPDAQLTSPNYALMDRLGDRDAVYSVGTLLARKFPHAVVSLISSDDFERHPLSGNLVVIGGPGRYLGDGWEFGNSAHRVFVEKLGSNVSYTDEADAMRIGGVEYRSRSDRDGRLMEDYGAFASFENPYHRTSRIVMLHGVHTLGVVGATRVFDGSADSEDNLHVLSEWLHSSSCQTGFETFFNVDILNGTVACPRVDTRRLYCLGESRSARPDGTRPQQTSQTKEELVATIKVALQGTIQSNRARLEELLELVTATMLTEGQLNRMTEICAANPLIPRDRVDELREVMAGNG